MDYYIDVQKVMDFLKEKRVCSSSIASHEECYRTFGEYLAANQTVYSTEAGKQWLTSIKETHNRQKCYFWYQYLIQLEEMATTGKVSDRNFYQNRSFYDKVPSGLKEQLDDYLDSCRHKYSKRSLGQAKIYCSEVMLFFADRQITKVEEITYRDVISLYNSSLYCSDKTKSTVLGHAGRMMSFLSRKGLCRSGYATLLERQVFPYAIDIDEFAVENRASMEQLRNQDGFLSANEFYSSIGDFIETLKDYGYVGTTLHLARQSLLAIYLFLDIHGLGYHPEISWIWFAENKANMGISWKHWRRILKSYEEYTTIGNIIPAKKYTYGPSALEMLPEWCRKPIVAFLDRKRREFRNPKTIRTSQYPCIRFCKHLINCNISTFSEVTPAVVSEFCRTDYHATFKGRSSYLNGVRQFLEFLMETGIVPDKSLRACISTGAAPTKKIVDILTDDQIGQINDYRLTRVSPIELRETAMVMVALRMGFRASDVVNLKISDIDWKLRKIDIVQQKTQSHLTLPMPIDVGNSIYTYIKDGRPKSSDSHVFIRHKAPYTQLTIKNCTKALHSIVPERKNIIGGGFHVTRRTFATRLLRNNAQVETVTDTLGHNDNSSVMKYLSLDEERMRTCALSLFDTGLLLQKAGLL